ncbi:hypothetical protein ACFL20_03990 [Spirochaetota bacterium]
MKAIIKKLSILFLILTIGFAVSGCKDGGSSSLIGTWVLTEVRYARDSQLGGSNCDGSSETVDVKYIAKINEDNTYQYVMLIDKNFDKSGPNKHYVGLYGEKGTYTLEGKTFTSTTIYEFNSGKDFNSSCGFEESGESGWVDKTDSNPANSQTVTVSGNTATFENSEGSYTYTRATIEPDSSLTGTWALGMPVGDNEKMYVVTLIADDGSYTQYQLNPSDQESQFSSFTGKYGVEETELKDYFTLETLTRWNDESNEYSSIYNLEQVGVSVSGDNLMVSFEHNETFTSVRMDPPDPNLVGYWMTQMPFNPCDNNASGIYDVMVKFNSDGTLEDSFYDENGSMVCGIRAKMMRVDDNDSYLLVITSEYDKNVTENNESITWSPRMSGMIQQFTVSENDLTVKFNTGEGLTILDAKKFTDTTDVTDLTGKWYSGMDSMLREIDFLAGRAFSFSQTDYEKSETTGSTGTYLILTDNQDSNNRYFLSISNSNTDENGSTRQGYEGRLSHYYINSAGDRIESSTSEMNMTLIKDENTLNGLGYYYAFDMSMSDCNETDRYGTAISEFRSDSTVEMRIFDENGSLAAGMVADIISASDAYLIIRKWEWQNQECTDGAPMYYDGIQKGVMTFRYEFIGSDLNVTFTEDEMETSVMSKKIDSFAPTSILTGDWSGPVGNITMADDGTFEMIFSGGETNQTGNYKIGDLDGQNYYLVDIYSYGNTTSGNTTSLYEAKLFPYVLNDDDNTLILQGEDNITFYRLLP